MSNHITVSSGYDPNLFKEYCNIPSRVIRGIKSCNLPSKAREIWEVVYDSGKYDLNREVYGLTVDKIQQIIGAKSRRTPEMHLATLVKLGYLEITPNYSDSGRRLPNTYKPLIPQELLQKMTGNTVKLSVTPRNPIIPRNVEIAMTPNIESYNLDSYHSNTYDDLEYTKENNVVELDLKEYFNSIFDISKEGEISPEIAYESTEAVMVPETVEPIPANFCGTYNYHEDNIDINNCYNSKDDCFDTYSKTVQQSDAPKIVEYFPAKQKPQSLSKAVLRHMLEKPVKFEAHVTDTLTVNSRHHKRAFLSSSHFSFSQ